MIEKYSKEELIEKYLKKEAEILAKKIKTTQFEQIGLPHIRFYNRRWGNFNKFLETIGKPFKKVDYSKKHNSLRFFYPSEWMRFLNIVTNEDHRFFLEFMLHTGMRINEARNISLSDIDFERRIITIRQAVAKGGIQRQIVFSSYLRSRVIQFTKSRRLIKTSNFGYPSTQYMDKMIKIKAKEAGIEDYKDFSCHAFRRTLEMWLLGLGIDSAILTPHFGHTIQTATAHYISSMLMNTNDKSLAKSILNDLMDIDKKFM